MKLLKWIFLILVSAPLSLWAQANLSLDQVVAKLEGNFNQVKTYQAQFEQEVKSEQFGKTISKGKGELFYAKPGKMVWHYTAPEEHWYITNGKLFWDYLPSAKQALEMKLDEALSSALPKSFLFGMAKISEQFTVAFHPSQDKSSGVYRLVLIPKKEEDRIILGTMELVVDAKSFLVSEVRIKDSLGNENSLKFLNIKVNPKINEKIFNFQPAQGVELIREPELTPGKQGEAEKPKSSGKEPESK